MIDGRGQLLNQYLNSRGPGGARQADIDYINSLGPEAIREAVGSPRTFLERELATRSNEEISARPTPTRDAAQSTPATFEAINNVHVRVGAAREYASELLEQLRNEQKNQPMANWLLDQGGQMVPFYKGYQSRNRLAQVPGAVLPGEQYRGQTNWYYEQPLDVSTTRLDQTVRDLRAISLQYAIDFVDRIVDSSTSNYGLATMGALANIAPGIGFVPYKAGIAATPGLS